MHHPSGVVCDRTREMGGAEGTRGTFAFDLSDSSAAVAVWVFKHEKIKNV
jgi:hypothetical protein